MRRVSVIGCSGSGKTTTARAIADRLGLRYLELDSIFHQPGWTPKPDAEFRAEVAEFARAKHWVIDGNYTSHGVADVVWPAADTVVWLDPPRRTVMGRVIKRTLRRVVTREELWNGNREPWSNLWNPRPEKNIIMWSWTRFQHYRDRYESAHADGTWGHLDVHRLRTQRDVDAFLSALR
jgi:adenylate kinase family enzyme